MKLIIGIIVAPRPAPTFMECVKSLDGTGVAPILFCEPFVPVQRSEYIVVDRPCVETEKCSFTTSYPEGIFGNFQNWIQAGRDLLEISDDADTFLICEDDALFTFGIRSLLERDLWPSAKCGAVSLYCPNMRQYASKTGLFRTDLVSPRGPFASGRNNLVGSLALVFPRCVLERLVYDEKSISAWKGSHAQSREKNLPPWQRKAVDTWIGKTLVKIGKELWTYSPSLVLHYSPLPARESNSSMGHPAPRGQHSARQCREWIGTNPGNLLDIYPHAANLFPYPV